MHSLTADRCLGRMEYLLSPDEKDPLLTQKGRQELWKRIQDMAREIDRQDREINELKEDRCTAWPSASLQAGARTHRRDC